MNKASFSVDSLFQNAWQRFRQRFVKALLTTLLGIGIIILATLVFLIVEGILVFLGIFFHHPLAFLVLIPLGIVAFLCYILVILWTHLAYVRILIREDAKVGVWQNMVEAKPLVISYFLLSIFVSLFSMGFWYLLFIPSLMWAIFGVFMIYFFLENRAGGLAPLWQSRQLVKGYFWQVLGRLLLFGLGSWGLLVLFGLNRNTSFLSFILRFLVIQPLYISFTYQMYLVLKKINSVKGEATSGIWPILSVIGWILLIILLIFTSTMLIGTLTNLGNRYKRPPRPVFYPAPRKIY